MPLAAAPSAVLLQFWQRIAISTGDSTQRIATCMAQQRKVIVSTARSYSQEAFLPAVAEAAAAAAVRRRSGPACGSEIAAGSQGKGAAVHVALSFCCCLVVVVPVL